jgi:PleD family two-component response regulator
MPDDTIPTAAMQRADAALYRAKGAGRNCVALARTG